MRKLLVVIILAALAWSAYWFIGAQGHKAAMTKWLDDRRSEGWQVEYSDHKVRGFPNRFDTTLTDLALTDPETGISWQAPFFQILSLSYKPNHLIAVWPNTQTVATPYEKFDIKTSNMRASLIVKPSATLALESANVEMAQGVIASSDGWTAGFDALNAAIRNTPATDSTYDAAVTLAHLPPRERARALTAVPPPPPHPVHALPSVSPAALAAPLDRRALEARRPDVTNLAIRDLRGTWGELELRAKGDMAVKNAKPEGDLAITARNWRDMLALAVQSGALTEGAASAAEIGLGFMANASGGANSLDATLTFRGGATFIGPLPIGPAPRIELP